ncbi:hypothetical protein SprV_0301242100 [Sparganum proliferum]
MRSLEQEIYLPDVSDSHSNPKRQAKKFLVPVIAPSSSEGVLPFFAHRISLDLLDLASRPGVLHLSQPLLYKATTAEEGCFVVIGVANDVGFMHSVLLGEQIADGSVHVTEPVLMLPACATADGQGRRLDCVLRSTPSVIHGGVLVGGGIVWKTTDRSLNLRTQVTGTLVMENSFQTFVWITLFLNILSLIILFFSSVSRYLRRAYKIQQSRYSIKFRDFSFFLMASDLCFAYSHYMGLEQCHDFKNCQSLGPSMLSWRYFAMLMHFNYTLAVVLAKRTQQLEGLMFNLTIGAFIATRVVNEVMRKHYSDKFLNSGCMPIHFRIMVVRPTAVILVLTFILLVNHLRSANHRYMAEWLGCSIHALGGLVILILMSFVTYGDTNVGSNNFVGLTFSAVFVMCLVDTIYFTFLKPNMILYYHRLYLVTVHKKTLENAAVEQLTSPLLSCMYKLDTDTAAKEGRSRTSTRTSSTATSSSLNTTSDSDYSTSRDSSRKSKEGESESSKDNKA